MKKLAFVLIAFFVLSIQQSKAQTYPYTKIGFEYSDADASILAEYYIDGSKILHYRLTVRSFNPFAYDGNPPDNMVGLIIGGWPVSPGYVFADYLDECSYPYSDDGVYTDTVDLSSFTNTEIESFTMTAWFWFRVNDEFDEFDHYAPEDFRGSSYLEL